MLLHSTTGIQKAILSQLTSLSAFLLTTRMLCQAFFQLTFEQCVFSYLFYFLYCSIYSCPSGLLCILQGLPTSLFLLWCLHGLLECSCWCLHLGLPFYFVLLVFQLSPLFTVLFIFLLLPSFWVNWKSEAHLLFLSFQAVRLSCFLAAARVRS